MYMYSTKTQYLSSFYFFDIIYNLPLTFKICSNNHSWWPPNFKSISYSVVELWQ